MRLACLNHAASVQAEPGSNSSIVFRGPSRFLLRRVTHPLAGTRWRRLTVSGEGLSSKKNLSADRHQTIVDRLLLPRHRLRRRGQSTRSRHPRASPGSSETDRCKAQNIFLARPDATSGRLLKLNDTGGREATGRITYLRAPRRRFEIRTCARSSHCTQRPIEPHALAANIRLFTCQRTLTILRRWRTTAFRPRNARIRLPQVHP